MLSADEQSRLRDGISHWNIKQAKVRLCASAQVRAGSSPFQAVVVLAEHAVGIFKITSKSAEALHSLHFLDLRLVTVRNTDRLELSTSKVCVELTFDQCETLVRELVRGYQLSVHTKQDRCKFELGGTRVNRPQTLFPFQKFPLSFSAYATYYGQLAAYCPDLAAYFFSQCAYRNFAFEFEDVQCTSSRVVPFTEWKPVICAYLDTPWCPIFVVGHCHYPDLINCASVLVTGPTGCRVLCLTDLGAKTGGEGLARFLQTGRSPLRFLDFSGNRLQDALKFAKALETADVALEGLVLNDMELDEVTVGQLLKSLATNPALSGLQEFSIMGSRISSKNAKLLLAWLAKIANEPLVFGVGPLADVSSFVKALCSRRFQLFALRIVDSALDDAVPYLCQYVQTTPGLMMFDISRSSIKEQPFRQLMSSIGSSTRQRGFILHLSGVFPKTRPKWLFDGIDCAKNNIDSLFLDGNDLSADDLTRFSFVKKISLSGIFSAKTTGTGRALAEFVRQSQPESLIVSGKGTAGLQIEALPMLQALRSSPIKMLDVSHNRIHDDGCLALADLVRESKTIMKLRVQDMGLSGPEPLKRLLDACANSESLLEVPFPMQDFQEFEEKAKSKKSRTEDARDLEKEIAFLRGKMNARLQVNRFVANPRVTSSLFLKGDLVLARVISAVTEAAQRDYCRYPVSHFGAILSDDDKAWQFSKGFGLTPPTARLRNCEADNRVKAKRRARQGGKRSRLESDDGSRSGDASDGRSPEEGAALVRPTPIVGPGPGTIQGPMPSRPKAMVEVPKTAYPPALPSVSDFPEPELSFVLIWPESDDELWKKDENMAQPPESRCPGNFLES
jgi:hypothetical protein